MRRRGWRWGKVWRRRGWARCRLRERVWRWRYLRWGVGNGAEAKPHRIGLYTEDGLRRWLGRDYATQHRCGCRAQIWVILSSRFVRVHRPSTEHWSGVPSNVASRPPYVGQQCAHQSEEFSMYSLYSSVVLTYIMTPRRAVVYVALAGAFVVLIGLITGLFNLFSWSWTIYGVVVGTVV